ncbi:MAG: cysteine desulfurase [Fimbriimonadaceae bacterium]|nr:cysteine desulfurase [Fimbriimonadaceae bacterium]
MIYLDHAATTPLDPRVLDAMLPYLQGGGNASSLHQAGRAARKVVEDSRERIAAQIGARPTEIVFTSGGSESDSYTILGTARARAAKGRHLLCSPLEHHAVLHAMEQLAREGFELEYLAASPDGFVDPAEVAARLRPETALVAVMHANNEIGTVQPVAALGAICRAAGVPLQCDAVQSLGLLAVDVQELGVSLLAGTAHKLHGPLGCGFAYVRTGTRPRPLILGGTQERNRRAGTENVAGIVGLATALDLAVAERAARSSRLELLRERLLRGLQAQLTDWTLNGAPAPRLGNNVNLSIAGVSGENLLILLDGAGICVSTGSACASGATDPSHVLLATVGRERAFSSLRISLAHTTTEAEIDALLEALPPAAERLRELLPAAATAA